MQLYKKTVDLCNVFSNISYNTRAVPLVRKENAHKGRVIFLHKSQITEHYIDGDLFKAMVGNT